MEAASTEEALGLLRLDGDYELLIADLLMPPGPDGLVLIREARVLRPGLPAVLVSGSEVPPGSVPMVLEEVSSLRKPVSPAELADLLATLTREEKL